MPRRRNPVQTRTGRHRKQPMKRVQRAYRHIRGLTCAQVDLRSLMQHDIFIHDTFQCNLVDQLLVVETELNYASCQQEIDNLEAQYTYLAHLLEANWQLRFDKTEEEAELFDIDPALDIAKLSS